jgi:hypothetical protein
VVGRKAKGKRQRQRQRARSQGQREKENAGMHECENAGMKELKEWKKIQESRYKIGRCGGTPFRVGVARQEYKNEKKDKELRAKRKRKCGNA